MTIADAIKDYLLDIEVRKYTPKTIRSYRNNLNIFMSFCSGHGVEDMSQVSLATVKSFTKYMVGLGRKGTYINSLLKTLKSFIQYCYEEEYGGFDTRKSFKWCKEEKPVIRVFEPADVKKMLADCRGTDYVQARDAAILTMLFETGIRCWELCCIRPENIHGDFVIIDGKNHKQRVVPVTPILAKALAKYERARSNYFNLRQTDEYYFLSFHGKQMTNSAVEHVVKKHGEGITGVRISPHTCRHFYAQQQVKMGTDLYTISRLLGHENIRITQTYLNSLRDDEIIQMAKQKSVLGSL